MCVHGEYTHARAYMWVCKCARMYECYIVYRHVCVCCVHTYRRVCVCVWACAYACVCLLSVGGWVRVLWVLIAQWALGSPCSVSQRPFQSGCPLQYGAWRVSWTAEPGRLQSMGSQRVRCNSKTKQRHTYFTKGKTAVHSNSPCLQQVLLKDYTIPTRS